MRWGGTKVRLIYHWCNGFSIQLTFQFKILQRFIEPVQIESLWCKKNTQNILNESKWKICANKTDWRSTNTIMVDHKVKPFCFQNIFEIKLKIA